MRFSDKLFFTMTSLMTVIFAFFGVWILSSFFQNLLNRELEQGSVESQMFQYVFEMAYEAVPEEYGEEYALTKATDSVMGNLAKADNSYYIFDSENRLLYGNFTEQQSRIRQELIAVQDLLNEVDSYGCHVIEHEGSHYLLSSCRSTLSGRILYLDICKDISPIFEDRAVLMNQYRFALALLLIMGAMLIFILSRYITKPIRELSSTARHIAYGNLTVRSSNRSQDEIGELARNFNRMADELVERVKEKEEEARQKEQEAREKEEEARQKAEEARQKALEAKQQEDFTAAFAHELKTPLTSIIGYADMLGTMQLTEAEKSESAYYIFRQGKRLESLSHKLLELVGMDKQELEKRPISTKDMEENIRATMRPVFHNKRIRGKINLEKARITGDKDLLLSLLYNLLDNATKAVEPGGFILLKGSRLEREYEFKVVDNGRGIPQEEISRITEAFYMVDKSRSRKEGGAGIGMALCQKIVRLHQGQMHIDSRLGEGTVVRILLPLE